MAGRALSSRAREILARMDDHYPGAECALHHDNPVQLLVATILSAQCTDARVNQVTPALFRRYPDAAAFANSRLRELESLIRATGFFRTKARNIRECCRRITRDYGGKVPPTLEALVTLPGVGRKTANVVLGTAFGVPGITVDTHVGRVSRRLGLTRSQDPVRVEFDLMRLIPRERWSTFSLQVIWHGRRICDARRPRCEECFLRDLCPFAPRTAKGKKSWPTASRRAHSAAARPPSRRSPE